ESGSSVPEFDFSSISLDLKPRSEPQPAADAPLSAGGDSPEELATKLELAVAYDEIGDKDGARELLQEVLRAGDASQKARAQELLGKLG
ncbi:MAG: FimV/HubP family polar landmark protein, partial [Quisquiliibacterium sp.]